MFTLPSVKPVLLLCFVNHPAQTSGKQPAITWGAFILIQLPVLRPSAGVSCGCTASHSFTLNTQVHLPVECCLAGWQVIENGAQVAQGLQFPAEAQSEMG